MRRGLIAVVTLSTALAGPMRTAAQVVEVGDSVPAAPSEPLFTPADAYFVGGFLLGTLAMAPLDRQIAREVRDSLLQENRWLQHGADVFRVLGYPGSIALSASAYLAGRMLDQPQLADMGLHTVESIIMAEAITMPLKSITGRARPVVDLRQPYDFKLGRGWRRDDYESFPSGHASAAFATAAAVTSEVGEWWPERKFAVGTVMFTGATLVAISRLYDNKHWASDVVVGAAIGSFSGWKIVRYTHHHPDSRLNRWLLPTAVAPTPNGVLLVWTFSPGTHQRKQ